MFTRPVKCRFSITWPLAVVVNVPFTAARAPGLVSPVFAADGLAYGPAGVDACVVAEAVLEYGESPAAL
jgi:hypothetical protein